MNLKTYPTKLAVANQFSEFLAKFIAGKEAVSIALSGGSTPKIVFDMLVANYVDTINWNAIHLYWGDERCVPPEDDESNYKMTRKHLLSKVPIPENNIHRIQGENIPTTEAERYGQVLETTLEKHNGIPQFDLVILGMGDDGHTASIFPHEIQLWNSSNNCEVATHPTSGQRRISLTGKIINNAKTVAFIVTGGGKAAKVNSIINKTENYSQYPAAHVSPDSGELYWFLDADAATDL